MRELSRQERILQQVATRFGGKRFESLEHILTSADGFGLSGATPLQRAICRVVDGIPLDDLKNHEHVRKAIGDVSNVEGVRPKKIVLCAGIRTFKSMLAAAAGILSPQVVDTSPMLDGEGARFSVVSTSKDNARKVFSHAMLLTQSSRILSDDPTADTLKLKHREGREFTFKVVHGGRAGAGLVSDWSSGVVFDEAARMLSSDQGVINIDDGIDAVEGRLLPGAQMFLLSSPWAPFGTFYEWTTAHHLKPTPDLVVIWAEAPWLNPVWWSDERCAEMSANNPDAYATDVQARFRTPEENIFSDAIVEPARRKEPWNLPYERGCSYEAAMDPATRRNAWTFAAITKKEKITVAIAHQWIATAGKPLRPREVLDELAQLIYPYGINTIFTDQWSIDALYDLAIESKLGDGSPWPLYLVERNMTNVEKVSAYGKIKTLLEQNELELHPDPHLRDDLIRVKKKTTQNGLTIHLPLTADGRHCDFAPVLALATAPYTIDYEEPLPPEGTPEFRKAQEALDIEFEKEEIISRQDDPFAGFELA